MSDLEEMVVRAAFEMSEHYAKHLEEFAAAFIKHTALPPDQVVMKVQNKLGEDGVLVQTIWFEKKE